MDARTLRYYEENAEALLTEYSGGRSGVEKYFALAFPRGGEILDIGSGSGRDVDILVREEYEAFGTEPSAKLRELAVIRFPRIAGRISAGVLPGLSKELDRKFDGILCAAVFQHIPQEEQFDAAVDVRNLLKENGRLLLSVPSERPGIDPTGRDDRGRLFTRLVPEALQLLFERLGFQQIGRWEDADRLGRPGVRWTTLLFVLRSDQGNAAKTREGDVEESQ
jgi:SAM-dependent methyltransferase